MTDTVLATAEDGPAVTTTDPWREAREAGTEQAVADFLDRRELAAEQEAFFAETPKVKTTARPRPVDPQGRSFHE